MGPGQYGYRPPTIHLLDEQLHLNPETIQIIQEIEARMAGRQLINLWLQPKWEASLPTWQSILRTPVPAPAIPQYTPGAGPSTPRHGELNDITSAVYQLPVVQGIVSQAHDEAFRQLRVLRSEWDQAGTGNRVLMISMTTIVVGSMVTMIVANQPTRTMAFDLIKGHDIPVPGVSGLSFRILDRGAGVTAPLGVPGLSGSTQVQVPASGRPDYNLSLSFDLMEFLRSRH